MQMDRYDVALSPAITTTLLVRFDTQEEAEAYLASCPPEVREWLGVYKNTWEA